MSWPSGGLLALSAILLKSTTLDSWTCLQWSPNLHQPALAKNWQISPDGAGGVRMGNWVFPATFSCSCLQASPHLHHPCCAKNLQTSPEGGIGFGAQDASF